MQAKAFFNICKYYSILEKLVNYQTNLSIIKNLFF